MSFSNITDKPHREYEKVITSLPAPTGQYWLAVCILIFFIIYFLFNLEWKYKCVRRLFCKNNKDIDLSTSELKETSIYDLSVSSTPSVRRHRARKSVREMKAGTNNSNQQHQAEAKLEQSSTSISIIDSGISIDANPIGVRHHNSDIRHLTDIELEIHVQPKTEGDVVEESTYM